MTNNTTPLQQAIFNVRGLKDREYSKEEIVTILQSLLPKEKEFVGKVFDAGEQYQYERDNYVNVKAPNKYTFLKQYYKS